jgi:hypothetical protein
MPWALSTALVKLCGIDLNAALNILHIDTDVIGGHGCPEYLSRTLNVRILQVKLKLPGRLWETIEKLAIVY